MSILGDLARDLGVGVEILGPALRYCLATQDVEECFDSRNINRALIELDGRLGRQIDEILHAPKVQQMESHWREAAYVVENVVYDDGRIITEILSCSKDELLDDFVQSPEVSYSGLYRLVYSLGAGLFGGTPYALICALFEFGPGTEDIALLRYCGAVAAISHAPFISNASPAFLKLDSFCEFRQLSDLEAVLSGPRFTTWNSFRNSEDARYCGLCLPRFLLRPPYRIERNPRLAVRYSESISSSTDILWGHASTLFLVIAAHSFSRYRWCVFLSGARAGRVAPMIRWELESFEGIWQRCPLEFQLTVRSERVLAEHGFIGFVFEHATSSASMLSTPSQISAQPLGHRVDSGEDIGARLGAQLNYMLLVCRLAHYIKVIQQERVGQGISRRKIERELQIWLRQYISDMDDASVNVIAKRPFRQADVRVEEIPGQIGWYRCRLELRPHMTHNSASFTLSLVGLLEQSSTATEEVES